MVLKSNVWLVYHRYLSRVLLPVQIFCFYFARLTMKKLWEQINNWELWPFKLRYAFITPMWLWYCIRSGSAWFFSASNPTLTFGGFEGEGKKEMYDLLPAGSYPKTIFIDPRDSFENTIAAVQEHQFVYPFCVKPDVGMKGLLFRKIDNEAQLKQYHQKMPVTYIIQDLILYPLEVSVFYYRYPGQAKGVITGFLQKDLMEVKGNGEHTLLQLIQAHPKAKFREEEMRSKHAEHLEKVLADGEKFYLTYAANLNRGAQFSNLAHLIDDELLEVFDALSHPAQFYYGRYDLKCSSIEDLKKGRNFYILEFNGSGAEPNHVYQSGYSLLAAQKVFLQHWKVLYQISRINHENGVPYWPFKKGYTFLKESKKHLALLEKCDTQILV